MKTAGKGAEGTGRSMLTAGEGSGRLSDGVVTDAGRMSAETTNKASVRALAETADLDSLALLGSCGDS